MLRRRNARKGNTLVLSMFLMVILLGMLAFTVDLGYVYVTSAQLQRSADSAAMAAAWDLIDDDALLGAPNETGIVADAQTTARSYASVNYVLAANPDLADEDIEIGYIEDPFDPASPLVVDGADMYNAVRVRVRRHSEINGEVPLFFARFLGHDSAALQAQATAVLLVNVRGFEVPEGEDNVGILPIALEEQTWLNMLAGGGGDAFQWNEDTGAVQSGADSIREINLYPQGVNSPGNFGTIDIGGNDNSSSVLARQILYGPTRADLAHHGGKIELDENGELFLNGDTGISAGIKDELTSIIGKPRVIPIYRTVAYNGNNATFTIVAFVGIRILAVELEGPQSRKHVTIQPANVVLRGGIPETDQDQKSQFVYSPVWLAR